MPAGTRIVWVDDDGRGWDGIVRRTPRPGAAAVLVAFWPAGEPVFGVVRITDLLAW